MVVQLIRNQQVVGSNPIPGSISKRRDFKALWVFEIPSFCPKTEIQAICAGCVRVASNYHDFLFAFMIVFDISLGH